MHTHNVNRAPEGEMNTEWRRVIQSKEWDGDESPTLSLAMRKEGRQEIFLNLNLSCFNCLYVLLG